MILIGIIWFLCVFGRLCAGYNVEVKKVGRAIGPKDSQFGYTVIFANDDNWDPSSKDFHRKVLLAGAPNLEVDNIRAHGDVLRCGPITTEDSLCTKMNMKDPGNICKLLRGGKETRSHCEEDSRMGASMSLNRKYNKVYQEYGQTPMVTMCAPGWKSVLKEDEDKFEKYMFGMCLKIRHDHRVMDCPISGAARSFCWPFWGGNVEGQTPTDNDGRAVFAYAIGGFSSAFTKDGKAEVIGAPGVNRNRGAYRAFHMDLRDWLVTLNWESNSTTYYGYSIDSGNFENGANLVIGNPNFHTSEYGHRGRVEMRAGTRKRMQVEFRRSGWTLCRASPDSYNIDLTQVKEQVGSKFGAVVASINIDGQDDYEEVFIGAPLYSDRYVEEGRVFVFDSSDFTCLLGILSGVARVPLLEEQSSFGRFGSAISPAGDLDGDGIEDVAVGAPYENGGIGAVYIYSGIGEGCNCHMQDKYTQRIVGNAVDPLIKSFGFSIFGDGDDVDDNGFPDLAVGAYVSDKAFIFRTRPVAMVTAAMEVDPQPIPLVATFLKCSVNKTFLCFSVSLTIQYEDGPGNDGRPIEVRFYLDADTKYKQNENGRSRIEFRKNRQSVLNETITVQKGSSETVGYILDVRPGDNGKPEPRDPWTTVKISGYYELIPTAGNYFDKLDHILSKSASRNFSAEADFDKKCDNIADCTSDLDLRVDLYLLGDGESQEVNESTVIYVDDKNQMEMVIEVMNTLNVSYRTNVSADVLAALRREVTQDGAIPAECKYELFKMPTKMNCTAQEELDKNEDMRVKTKFDISRARLVPDTETLENMQQFVNVSVFANQGNTDEDMTNNAFDISIPVMIKSQIDITVDTKTSHQVRYNADPESTRAINVRHIYYVTNNGPSFLPKTFVNISIPYKRDGETFAKVTSNGLCTQRGKLTQTTTETPSDATTSDYDPDIDEPEIARKRRDTDPEVEKLTEKKDEKKEQAPKIRNITCEEYECVVFECELVKMEKAATKTIDLSIDVAEKEIAREKNFREVRFVTNASATPPTIWFSGKVVPWDKPEEEDKATTFIVEPASVVTEVNIWIIIGSVLGAVALLIIIMVVLWKTGFFRRKKQQQLRKLRQESLYKRRSQMRPTSTMSTTRTNPPYNQIEADGEKS